LLLVEIARLLRGALEVGIVVRATALLAFDVDVIVRAVLVIIVFLDVVKPWKREPQDGSYSGHVLELFTSWRHRAENHHVDSVGLSFFSQFDVFLPHSVALGPEKVVTDKKGFDCYRFQSKIDRFNTIAYFVITSSENFKKFVEVLRFRKTRKVFYFFLNLLLLHNFVQTVLEATGAMG
jgi:hypothetical protein